MQHMIHSPERLGRRADPRSAIAVLTVAAAVALGAALGYTEQAAHAVALSQQAPPLFFQIPIDEPCQGNVSQFTGNIVDPSQFAAQLNCPQPERIHWTVKLFMCEPCLSGGQVTAIDTSTGQSSVRNFVVKNGGLMLEADRGCDEGVLWPDRFVFSTPNCQMRHAFVSFSCCPPPPPPPLPTPDKCPPLVCTLMCENGFERDENGCEICRCAS